MTPTLIMFPILPLLTAQDFFTRCFQDFDFQDKMFSNFDSLGFPSLVPEDSA